jgi:hypothetical protein
MEFHPGSISTYSNACEETVLDQNFTDDDGAVIAYHEYNALCYSRFDMKLFAHF